MSYSQTPNRRVLNSSLPGAPVKRSSHLVRRSSNAPVRNLNSEFNKSGMSPKRSSVEYRVPFPETEDYRVSRSPTRRSSSVRTSRSPSPVRRSPSPVRRSPSPVRRSPVRRSPVRSSPSPVRRSPVRRSPVRSSPVRSSPVRRSPVRSSPVRRSPVRRSPVRSSPVRRPTSSRYSAQRNLKDSFDRVSDKRPTMTTGMSPSDLKTKVVGGRTIYYS